jgi:multidrug efflux pump subunit AcrA (membrane-fusion protein)
MKKIAFLWLCLLIILAGCSGNSASQSTPTPIPTPIVPTKPTYDVQRGDIERKLVFAGRMAPAVEQDVYFRTPGYVQAVYVKNGDEVKTGDVLAELDVTDLRAQLAQAEAVMAQQQAAHEQTLLEARIAVQAARLEVLLADAEEPHPDAERIIQKYTNAQENLAEVQQDVADAGGEAQAGPSLVAKLRQAEQDFQQAEADYLSKIEAPQARLEMARLQLQLAEQRAAELEKALDLQESQLNLERLNAQLADAQLIAPIDGTLVNLNVFEGKPVEAYVPLITVADLSELEFAANLSSAEMLDIEQDMPVLLTRSSQPGVVYDGIIRSMPFGENASGSRENTLRVAFTTPPEGLDLGDLMSATVLLERKEDVLWLPPQAIRIFEGREFVVVQDENGQRRVDVKLGIRGDDRVEVLEGLSEGQVVVGR